MRASLSFRMTALTALVAAMLALSAVAAWAGSYTRTRPEGFGTLVSDVGNRTLSNKAYRNSANAGNCIDSIFDWSTSSGHYDARVVRNCDLSHTRTINWDEKTSAHHDGDANNGLNINGDQKVGVCTSTATTRGGCSTAVGSVASVPTTYTDNVFTDWYYVSANGGLIYFGD